MNHRKHSLVSDTFKPALQILYNEILQQLPRIAVILQYKTTYDEWNGKKYIGKTILKEEASHLACWL